MNDPRSPACLSATSRRQEAMSRPRASFLFPLAELIGGIGLLTGSIVASTHAQVMVRGLLGLAMVITSFLLFRRIRPPDGG